MRIFSIFLVLFLSYPCVAQKTSKNEEVKFTLFLERDKLSLKSNQNKKYIIDLVASAVGGQNIDQYSLIHYTLQSDRVYFLLDVIRPSRQDSNGLGRCSGGQEAYLLWAAFDSDHNLLQKQLEIYSSCWQSLEMTSPAGQYPPISKLKSSNNLLIKSLYMFRNTEFSISYDTDIPHKGLNISEQVLEPSQ